MLTIATTSDARKWHLEALIAMKSLWEYLKTDTASADCVPYLLEIVGMCEIHLRNMFQPNLFGNHSEKSIQCEWVLSANAEEISGGLTQAERAFAVD